MYRPGSPTTDKYMEKYKSFKDLRTQKEEFVEVLHKTDKDKWDRFTKGMDSPHKKGKELKEMLVDDPTEKCEFSTYSAKKTEPNKEDVQSSQISVKISRPIEEKENAAAEEAATLKGLKDKDREAFLALREFYNSLDKV